ncbi:MAG: hypothetical protein QXU98_09805 [Candidatus Parvarchaeota archaeon]
MSELTVRNASAYVQYSSTEKLEMVPRMMGTAFLRSTRLSLMETMLGPLNRTPEGTTTIPTTHSTIFTTP